jgi:serine/threonine protein kinase
MPAPFSPNPADRSSVRQPAADKAPSTQTGSDDNIPEAEAITPLIGPSTGDLIPEAPTVLSANRPKRTFDARISEALAGRRLGHFELIEAVGAGGMAAVLKARDMDLGRIVALKILPPDMAADPENIVRFKQEARAAAKLDHENIARVYYFGEDQGLHFIAFEFVEGDNLRQLMDANGGTIPVRDAVALMLQVTAGLAHASSRGVVHRDIKPSNIIVTPDGRAKIVDMGLARSLDHRGIGQLTETGVTLGTFDYISPEQAIEPRSADVRSDIYSLGCTFYHALSGFSPVPDGNAAKKLDAQKNVLPPDPRIYNPEIPADLAVVLGRMMAKDPASRYQHPDHLAAHLRAVARKLGVPTGPLPAHGKAFEDPIPPPPRMSAAWILTAVAVMALAIGIFTNAFNRPQLPPGPDNGAGTAGPPEIDPGPGAAVVAGRRDAANVDELLALVKQGVKHIRLTGSEYDLFRYRDLDGQPVEVLLTGDDLRIEGTPGPNSPSLRLGNAPDGKSRSKTLTLRGPGNGKGTAHIRGVRFVLPALDSDDEDTGLLVAGFDRLTIEDCIFMTGYRPNRDGPSAVHVILNDGTAEFSRCYFAPGCVGLSVDGPGRVSMTECAIAPHYAGIRIHRSTPELSGETELVMSHCSALTPANGALIELGDLAPAVVRVGHCLFAGPDRLGPDEMPVVLRQRKNRAAATRYEAEPGHPNIYFNTAAYSEGEETYSFAQATQEKLPVADVERPIKHPWEDRDPFALLAAKPPNPRRAFTQNLRMPELRVAEDPTRSIIGTQYLGSERLYPSPFSPTESERDITVKVWDPSLSDTADDLPPGVYATLAKALASIRTGDTLLIRHTGRLEVDPCEFTRKDTNLTIKPDTGHRPILVPSPSGLKRASGLFKLYGGRLVLDGLHFRLPSDRAPAVAVLPGGGQLEIRNAVITMEDGEDLSAITFTDPRTEMMMGTARPDTWPVPKVALENVFLRGKGRLLSVKGSRPFELDVRNGLAALDSSLIDIEPSTADPSSAGSGIVRLNRLTAYLSGCLLQFRAADRKSEMGPTGLARTEITATGCVFTPAAGTSEPFVRADRIDTRDQAERWLSWRGKNNAYGYDKKKVILELRPTDIEAMPVKPIEGDRWLEMVIEEGDPFSGVFFEYKLPDAGQTRKFLGVRPIDFRAVRFDPPRPDGTETGAPADVPAPFPDE